MFSLYFISRQRIIYVHAKIDGEGYILLIYGAYKIFKLLYL